MRVRYCTIYGELFHMIKNGTCNNEDHPQMGEHVNERTAGGRKTLEEGTAGDTLEKREYSRTTSAK
jgi:hypothetical protein